MKIEVVLEPYCVGCHKMDIETHHFYVDAELMLVHSCRHRDICDNVIWQHNSLKDREENK